MTHPAPIGVFDSGMGGLTVLRALQQALPGESFVYLGDTARLPYGSKSPETVEHYALQAAGILIQRNIRALVVACNTASAFALEALRRAHPELPIFGVVEPGAAAAADCAPGASVLVLATESTVLGGAYQKALLNLRPDLRIHARAAPLLVALAEEGEHEGAFCESVLRHYLHGHLQGPEESGSISAPARIILGCTHFPVLKTALEGLLGDDEVKIVDSAETTARMVAAELGVNGLSSSDLTLLATDGAARFRRVGGYFLGTPIDGVELVDL
jgi:glutamate racemase